MTHQESIVDYQDETADQDEPVKKKAKRCRKRITTTSQTPELFEFAEQTPCLMSLSFGELFDFPPKLPHHEELIRQEFVDYDYLQDRYLKEEERKKKGIVRMSVHGHQLIERVKKMRKSLYSTIRSLKTRRRKLDDKENQKHTDKLIASLSGKQTKTN